MRDLRTLIQASGNAGTAGQSFRNHVTGSGTGTAMSDYFIGGQTWVYPAAPPTSNADNSVLYISGSCTQFGSKANAIKNDTTTAWGVSSTNISGGTGDSATLETVAWSSSTASLGIRVRGCFTPGVGTPTAGTPWYLGYTNPALPYVDPDYLGWSVRFTADAGAAVASGSGTMYVNISHTPDKYAAGFNPVYNNAAVLSNFIVAVDRRVGDPNLEWQWDDNSGFTSPDIQYGTSFDFTHPTPSYNTTTFSAWARYRASGSSDSYTLFGGTGEIPWTDPRAY